MNITILDNNIVEYHVYSHKMYYNCSICNALPCLDIVLYKSVHFV